jgi:hypothetical protein
MRGLNNIAGLISGTKLSKWLVAAAAAVTLAVPAVSQAAPGPWRGDDDRRGNDRRDYDRDHDQGHDRGHDHARGHDHDRGGFGLHIRVGERHPRYITRDVQVWVPAVYRTECEKVWVPDVFVDREVQFIGGKGRLRTRIDRVLVKPGHYTTRERQVLVSPGHYETRTERVKIDDGDWGFKIRS